MIAIANCEENSSDSSRPTPIAIMAVPSNSFFLHIKNRPLQSYVQEAVYMPYSFVEIYFRSQSLISFALSYSLA